MVLSLPVGRSWWIWSRRMTYLDKQISLSCFHTTPIGMQTRKLVPLPICCIPFLKGPDFLFFSSLPSTPPSISVTTCPHPPNPPPAFKLLCLLSLRLTCHFHRTQSKVESTIIQTPHRCLSQESADKNQLPYLAAAPRIRRLPGWVKGEYQCHGCIHDVHSYFYALKYSINIFH